MRTQAMASAIRATMSAAEAADLVTLARDAEGLGVAMSARLADTIALLDCARYDVQQKQAVKRADRRRIQDAEKRRRAREHHASLGEFNLSAERGDYADISRLPDFRLWSDMALREACGEPLPEQCEIRRDVWRVRVTRSRPGEDFEIIGSACTETSDRAEIKPLAENLIAKHAQPVAP